MNAPKSVTQAAPCTTLTSSLTTLIIERTSGFRTLGTVFPRRDLGVDLAGRHEQRGPRHDASLPQRLEQDVKGRRVRLELLLVNAGETALLVRGQDQHGHYAEDRVAESDFEADAVARHQELDRVRKRTWDEAAARW